MSIAAYNRGSRLVAREADERMPVATSRADAQAHKDEIARLREQVTTLERALARARRCLASERAGREALRVRLADEERARLVGVKGPTIRRRLNAGWPVERALAQVP